MREKHCIHHCGGFHRGYRDQAGAFRKKNSNISVLVQQQYLIFDVAVAANGPQIFEGPPQQYDEETPEKRHHGGREESPPHALAIIVTGHLRRERDDNVFHLGD